MKLREIKDSIPSLLKLTKDVKNAFNFPKLTVDKNKIVFWEKIATGGNLYPVFKMYYDGKNIFIQHERFFERKPNNLILKVKEYVKDEYNYDIKDEIK